MAFPSTFADITNAVIEKATLDPVLDVTKVHDWVNQVYFQAAIQTEAIPATSTINLIAGTSTYALAATIARIRQMVVKPAGSSQFNPPLIRTTLDEILQRRRNGYDAQTIGPWSTHYTLVGISDLELWPTPSAADVVTVYNVAYPTALAADSDKPVFEEPFASKILEFGALAEAGDFKGDPATAQWAGDYQQWLAWYVQHLQAKGGVIPGQFHQWGDGWSGAGWGDGWSQGGY